MLKSWKTTVSGVLAFLTLSWANVQTLLDLDPLTNPDYSAWIAAAIALVGLVFARDNDVSSEASGANAETPEQRTARLNETARS